jgi:hypothetical protein
MFNGLQLLALAIASAFVFAIFIKERADTMEQPTAWPTGKNPILSVLRETFDAGDKWGSNINFLFALCDIATKYEVEIPAELEFSPSPFGGDTDCYEYQSLEGLLIEGEYIYRALTLEEFRKHVGHALKVCARYDSLLRLAGENY